MKKNSEVWDILQKHPYDPLAVLKELGGYYECPKDASGKRLGPLVGYTGTYAPGMHYVGDVYANFAKIEEYPEALKRFIYLLACKLDNKLEMHDREGVICGAPMGGIAPAAFLAAHRRSRFVFAEKKVTKAASGGEREESELVFGRHEIEAGDRVILMEDVLNNFSTTAALCGLIREAGGEIIAIAGLLNRSLTVRDRYVLQNGTAFPVVALIEKPIHQYKQEDAGVAANVAADIEKGNVVWKPKAEWPRLMAAMEAKQK